MTRRLLASYLTLAVIVLLTLEIPLAITFARGERRALTDEVERDAVVLASRSEDVLEKAPNADPAAVAVIAALARDYTERFEGRVVIVDDQGQAIADTEGDPADLGQFATRPEIAEALAGGFAIGNRHSRTLGTDILYVAVPVASGGVVHGAVRITYPTATVEARVRRTWIILGAVAAVVLGVSALVGLRFASSIAGPLSRVERASVAAGEGDLSVRAPVEGPPEVRSLATRFNQMVSRLQELVRSQEAFVADASHQLRTPLAALRLRLENLESDVGPGGRDGLDAAISEVDRLNRLVSGLLVLARADSGDATRTSIDVRKLVDERVELWAALGDEQGVVVRGKVEGAVMISGAQGRLDQVLDNLIENALGVTAQGDVITVSARATPEAVIVTVSDTGPGMTVEERARAFDRFWRSERNSSDGTGLGLAIVRRLVEADGGTIELGEAPGGGLEVTVRYPPTLVRGLPGDGTSGAV